MENKIRNKIIKQCKSQFLNLKEIFSTGELEVKQDEIIEKECNNFGYTLSDFYTTNGKKINDKLKIY